MSKNFVNLQCFFSHPLSPQVIDKDTKLTVAVLTAVPPFVTEAGKMGEALMAFDKGIRKQDRLVVKDMSKLDECGEKVSVFYNLQNPPLDYYTEEVLAWFKSNGVISTQIAYAGPNRYGGGSFAPEAPLTEDGKSFVRNLAKVGMALDLSHTGYKTCEDILDLIEGEGLKLPIFVSHTGSTAVYNVNRNLTPDILMRVGKLGGVVGLFCITFLLDREDNSRDAFLKHMAMLFHAVGVNNVVIGSDTPATNFETEKWKSDTKMMKAKLDPKGLMGIRWPDYIPEFVHPKQMEIIYGAVKCEFGEYIATKVCGENALRFLKKII